ncbi:MAG: hypothetical protein QG588_1768, partial [Candidatus Poribacteria bacterium]|nr:hypothetical protein [Candidatus Poribacteria bacterium]
MDKEHLSNIWRIEMEIILPFGSESKKIEINLPPSFRRVTEEQKSNILIARSKNPS